LRGSPIGYLFFVRNHNDSVYEFGALGPFQIADDNRAEDTIDKPA
jgi:hypothetical protein